MSTSLCWILEDHIVCKEVTYFSHHSVYRINRRLLEAIYCRSMNRRKQNYFWNRLDQHWNKYIKHSRYQITQYFPNHLLIDPGRAEVRFKSIHPNHFITEDSFIGKNGAKIEKYIANYTDHCNDLVLPPMKKIRYLHNLYDDASYWEQKLGLGKKATRLADSKDCEKIFHSLQMCTVVKEKR